ncbi:MAG: hypothetical protein WKG01_32970 [Kofleriaceae bacterium]
MGPQVDDTPLPRSILLPAGSTVESVLADPVAAAQLAAGDGVDGRIALQTAFAGGAVIHVWDFGPAPAFAAPLFVVVERNAAGALVRTPHNTIIDALPGDPGYSPFWAPFLLEITDDYPGELLTSFEGVDEALRLGLVRSPIAETSAVNCPTVGAGVELEREDGRAVAPNATFYYRGKTVPYFDLGAMPLVDGVRVPEARRYQLRRQGEERLSEVLRHVDMDGDGDTNDTNDVYPRDFALTSSTPRIRTVDVVVRSTIGSIDSSQDESIADLRDASQLFAPGPAPGVVISYEVTEDVRNWAVQRAAGGP